MMNELIPIDFSGEQMKVSSRDLYEFLVDTSQKYQDWFSRMCKYGFVEDVDFNIRQTAKVQMEGGRQVTRQIEDAIMTMDMAKEICMVTRNEKGKAARQYFLKIEREWNSPDKVMARALKMADATIAQLTAKIEEDRPMTEFGLAISTSEGCISIAQLAAMLCQKGVDTGEHRLFAEMREDGFLNSSGMYYNKPAQRYLENKMMEYKVFKNKFNNKVTFQPLITPKGIQYFMDYYLRKHGKLPLLTVHRRTVIEKRPAAHRQSKGGQVRYDEIGG